MHTCELIDITSADPKSRKNAVGYCTYRLGIRYATSKAKSNPPEIAYKMKTNMRLPTTALKPCIIYLEVKLESITSPGKKIKQHIRTYMKLPTQK